MTTETYQVFAIFDQAMGTYMPPFYAKTNNHALRMFQDLVNDPSTPFSKHPADYALWHIGAWNEDTAAFIQAEHGTRAIIAQAAHLKERA